MRKVLLLFMLAPFTLLAGEFNGVGSLVKRRVPWLEGHVQFRKIQGDGEFFTLSSVDGKLLINATGANAAAEGLFTKPDADLQTVSLIPRGRNFVLRQDPSAGKVKWTIKLFLAADERR